MHHKYQYLPEELPKSYASKISPNVLAVALAHSNASYYSISPSETRVHSCLGINMLNYLLEFKY